MDIAASPIIILNPIDDVGVARQPMRAGGPTGYGDLMARELIGRGHKVAIRASRRVAR